MPTYRTPKPTQDLLTALGNLLRTYAEPSVMADVEPGERAPSTEARVKQAVLQMGAKGASKALGLMGLEERPTPMGIASQVPGAFGTTVYRGTPKLKLPKVLYHGSPIKGLKELDPRAGVEVPGTTWFSDNPEVAEDYIYPREYGEILSDEPPGTVYKASLAMKNPLVVDFNGEVGDAIAMSKLANRARREGYDGLIVRNVDDTVGSTNTPGTSYAVFNKTQIKLKNSGGRK